MTCPYTGEPCYEARACEDCWNYQEEEGPNDPD